MRERERDELKRAVVIHSSEMLSLSLPFSRDLSVVMELQRLPLSRPDRRRGDLSFQTIEIVGERGEEYDPAASKTTSLLRPRSKVADFQPQLFKEALEKAYLQGSTIGGSKEKEKDQITFFFFSGFGWFGGSP